MRVRPLLCLLLIAGSSALPAGRQASAPGGPAIHAIDRDRYADAGQFAFLTDTLKDVEVVSLGESIHLTHEFPLVRLGIIRHLNEHLGFHVLAMEGSAADIWVAQDRFLNSTGTVADAEDAQLGLFTLWNTPEVRQVFEYEAASWRSPAPLYITAYDIQPGSGQGSHGAEVFRLLAERLRAYAPPPAGLDLSAWTASLAGLTRGCNDFTSADRPGIGRSIDALADWSARAASAVTARFPAVPHGAALRLMPENLKASFALCTDLAGDRTRGYKAIRDTHAAEYALALKAAVPGGKLMLWAHLSHVFYNAEHAATSVGEKLHAVLGPRLYTIMPLAEGGGTILIYDDGKDDVGYGRVHGDRGDLGARMSRLSDGDFFLDLRDPAVAGDPVFNTPQPVWVESFTLPLAIAHDVDGIVWIKRVSMPAYPLLKRAVFASLHYQPEFEVVGVVTIVLLIAVPFYRRGRRRGVIHHRRGSPTDRSTR